jgi:hypothetical protein
MFCSNTPLAVIYADITESPESPDSNALIKDIRALEKAIWKHSTQKYLGIFTLKEGKVAEPFAEFAAFHASTETGWIAEEPDVFGPALQERLRSNGTTHLLFVGYEVAAAVLEAKKQGFQVCIFQPATRAKAPLPLEEMKSADIVVAEDTEKLVADFIQALSLGMTYRYCVHCDWGNRIPRWCTHQMGEFLWYALMRIRIALNAVIDSGFEGPMDPLTYLANKAIKQRPMGYWRCTYEQKHELEEAIDMATTAGIPTGNAIYICSFTWNSRASTDPYSVISQMKEVEALKEEVAMLKAQLAAAEVKTKPKSPSFYVSDEE